MKLILPALTTSPFFRPIKCSLFHHLAWQRSLLSQSSSPNSLKRLIGADRERFLVLMLQDA